jgi:prolipoprotein diacylglyceryltransferase
VIVIAALLIGAVTGYLQASRRNGSTFDKVQYAMVYAIIAVLIGLFATITIDRLN